MAGTSGPSRRMHLWRTNAPDEIYRRGEMMINVLEYLDIILKDADDHNSFGELYIQITELRDILKNERIKCCIECPREDETMKNVLDYIDIKKC